MKVNMPLDLTDLTKGKTERNTPVLKYKKMDEPYALIYIQNAQRLFSLLYKGVTID